MRCKEILKMKR